MLRQRRRKKIQSELFNEAEAEFAVSAEHVNAYQGLVEHAMSHLGPQERALTSMAVGGRSYKEIASRLGLSIHGAIRTLAKARTKLALALSDQRPTASHDRLQPRSIDGELYEPTTELALPETKIITGVAPAIHVASVALAERLKGYPEGVHDLTPRQFEELVGELLSAMTAGRIEITPFTRDGGNDLLAYFDQPVGRLLCLIETKKYRRDRTVGIGAVRMLYGVVCDKDASHGTLVTTSTFTADARKFEQQHRYRLSLRDYDHVAEWIRRYRTPPTK